MKVKVSDKPLGELLKKKNFLKDDQLLKALEIQKENSVRQLIGQILVELGFCDEENIAEALIEQYAFPYIPLRDYDINSLALNDVSREAALKHKLMPIEKIGHTLTVAMADPLNFSGIEEIKSSTKCNVQVILSTPAEIDEAISRYYDRKETLNENSPDWDLE